MPPTCVRELPDISGLNFPSTHTGASSYSFSIVSLKEHTCTYIRKYYTDVEIVQSSVITTTTTTYKCAV